MSASARPPLRALFPADRQRFLAAVRRAADYAVQTCGGPHYFTSTRGKPCMRKRHYPFTIDESAREIWLRHLWLAFDDVGFPVQIRQEYWEWVEPFSIRMINRRTQRAPPQRYPFVDVPRTLLQWTVSGAPWHPRDNTRQESAAVPERPDACQGEHSVSRQPVHPE